MDFVQFCLIRYWERQVQAGFGSFREHGRGLSYSEKLAQSIKEGMK